MPAAAGVCMGWGELEVIHDQLTIRMPGGQHRHFGELVPSTRYR